MMAGLWGGKLRAWQKRHGLYQKEAAEILGCPLQTYKDWCDGDSEPSKVSRNWIEHQMRQHDAKTQK